MLRFRYVVQARLFPACRQSVLARNGSTISALVNACGLHERVYYQPKDPKWLL